MEPEQRGEGAEVGPAESGIERPLDDGPVGSELGHVGTVKNLLVGVGNGLVTGTIAAVVAWLMNGDFRLGIILAMAMVINLFVAGLVGTLIPLGLKALKIDPALASAVFITTFTDVCGFASFLGLATLYTRYIQGAG